jgi:23S rRNA (pseudouridine1915-N3)-methyltransferase
VKIRVFWVGKTKDRLLADGIEKYLKLLRPMARVTVEEIKEVKSGTRDTAMEAEAKSIIKQTNRFTLLDESGREYSSAGFARYLKEKGDIDFVLGGPFGVSDGIKARAADIVALSKMTYTHEMARLILLEQVFRAMTIINNKEYHH